MTLVPKTTVTRVDIEDGQVVAVETDRGTIRTPIVVDAAGAWTRQVAAASGIEIPLVPTRHQLFVTEPLDGVRADLPIVRVMDAAVYVRPCEGGLLWGGYESDPRMLDMDELGSAFAIADTPLDADVLRRLADDVGEQLPALRTAAVREHRGGLPTMTADGQHIVGPAPGAHGLLRRRGLQRRWALGLAGDRRRSRGLDRRRRTAVRSLAALARALRVRADPAGAARAGRGVGVPPLLRRGVTVAATRQIAFLRGVNLGPSRRLAMADLRALLTDLGYDDARTLLQSGNVVLTATATSAALERRLEREIASALGLETEVIVRTRAELAQVVARNPLEDVADNPSRYLVTFLRRPPAKAALRELSAAELGNEAYAASGREVYSWHPDGIHASPLAKLIGGKRLGLGGTARNWNTVTKLLALADG